MKPSISSRLRLPKLRRTSKLGEHESATVCGVNCLTGPVVLATRIRLSPLHDLHAKSAGFASSYSSSSLPSLASSSPSKSCTRKNNMIMQDFDGDDDANDGNDEEEYEEIGRAHV